MSKTPIITVNVAICTIFNNDLKVLLVKRDHNPFKDYWVIPGKAIDYSEKTLEDSALLVLKEETGLINIYIEQLKTYGSFYHNYKEKTITIVYFALVPYNIIENQKIIEGYQWFSMRWDLPGYIAFNHGYILQDLLNRLIGKISYTEIAFKLVPLQFTWPELQRVYEIILGKSILASNFRRKIKSMYELKTLKKFKKNDKAGRPSIYISYVKTKVNI